MNSEIFRNNPLRPVQWRCNRVLKMLAPFPKQLMIQRYDDKYVRTYRHFLLEYRAAADDEERRDRVLAGHPHVYQAHWLYYSPEIDRRQILEARLLTSESFDEIAVRFAVEPPVVDYFEKLFFNIRDRMENSDWIRKVVLGNPDARTMDKKGIVTEETRGFLYRRFAYLGGPLALDAAISGIGSTKMPQRAEDVDRWFRDAFGQMVGSNGAAAASILPINRSNSMRLIKLALKEKKTSAKSRRQASPPVSDEYLAKVAAHFDKWAAVGGSPTSPSR